MNRDDPIFEAYDGVELRLLHGRVARFPALTTAEALRFARPPIAVDEDGMATEEGMFAIGDHFREFCERIELADVPLSDIALDGIGGIDFGHMTVSRGIDVAVQQSIASDMPDTLEGAQAVQWLLDEVPAELSLEAGEPAAEVFRAARALRIALYRHLDWLLRRFLAVLAMSPGVRTIALRAQGSKPASVT